MSRICLITPAHVANNPRLVKEADALAGAGYDVHVIASQYMEWATENDQPILGRAEWTPHLLQWGRQENPVLFWGSRLRRHAASGLLQVPVVGARLREIEHLAARAFDRVLPELYEEASQYPADLYIAHNLQALPVAAAVAEKHGAQLGFDAEDFHSGMRAYEDPPTLRDKIVEDVEQAYLPKCDYLTAASPGIAEAYVETYAISKPTPILNVFPLREQPDAFRPTDPESPLTLYWFSQTIGPKRGLEDAVQALAQLPDCDIELHLRGNWQSAEYRRHLYNLAGPAADGIVDHDPSAPDEMVSRSAQYDVGLALEQPVKKNREICLTNKIFTYLLAGNAVAATATSGQCRLLQKLNDVGFAYEPGDIDTLARKLQDWVDDRAMVDSYRRNAWTYGQEKYNWDAEKKKLLEVVDSVLP